MMHPQCDWKCGYVDSNGRAYCQCQRPRCGNKIHQTDPSLCDARCKALAAHCRHLGEATGEKISVKCVTCRKTTVITEYPINRCAVLSECLPTYNCTKDSLSESMNRDIATCRGCEMFEPQEKP